MTEGVGVIEILDFVVGIVFNMVVGRFVRM